MNLLSMTMLAIQFVAEFGLVRGLQRAVLNCDFRDCGESEKEGRHKDIDDWIQRRMPELCNTEAF